jgi:hypothetical protein
VPHAAGFDAQTSPTRTTKEWCMKTRFKLTLLACALLTATSAAAQAGVGLVAPAFVLGDTQGRPVALGDFKGRHVVLEWVNPGCPYVQNARRQGGEQAGDQCPWLFNQVSECGLNR